MTGTDMLEGIGTLLKQYDKSQHEAKEARSKKNQSSEQLDAMTTKLGQTAESYRNQLGDYKASLQKSRDAADEAFADRVISEEGGPVTPAKAAQIIDAENQSRKQHRDNQIKFLQMNAKFAKDSIVMGGKILGATMVDAGHGVAGSVFSASGLTSMFGGFVGGAVLGNSELSTSVQNAFSHIFGFDDLEKDNPTAEGVETKHVDGLETPDDYNAYMTDQGGGEPNDPYDPGTGPDADGTVEISLTPGAAAVDPNVEATSQSDAQLQELAEIGNKQYTAVTTSVQETAGASLQGAVAGLDTVMQNLPDEAKTAYTAAMQMLFDRVSGQDGPDQDQEKGAEGPDY